MAAVKADLEAEENEGKSPGDEIDRCDVRTTPVDGAGGAGTKPPWVSLFSEPASCTQGQTWPPFGWIRSARPEARPLAWIASFRTNYIAIFCWASSTNPATLIPPKSPQAGPRDCRSPAHASATFVAACKAHAPSMLLHRDEHSSAHEVFASHSSAFGCPPPFRAQASNSC